MKKIALFTILLSAWSLAWGQPPSYPIASINAPISRPLSRADIEGNWQGIYQCGSYNKGNSHAFTTHVTMQVQNGQATLIRENLSKHGFREVLTGNVNADLILHLNGTTHRADSKYSWTVDFTGGFSHVPNRGTFEASGVLSYPKGDKFRDCELTLTKAELTVARSSPEVTPLHPLPPQSSPQTQDIQYAALSLVELQSRANQGVPMAQYELGKRYEDARGVYPNYPQATFWYRKSAEQGNAKSQNALGIMYANGKGVSKDYQQALAWFMKAEALGDPSAQSNLGTLYMRGQGVPQDPRALRRDCRTPYRSAARPDRPAEA